MACLSVSFSRRVAWLLALGLVWLVPGLSRAAEVREFNVLVDGKRAGEYRMTVQRQDDGTLTMNGDADIKVSLLGLPVYSYTFRSLEVWKDGRLQRFESSGKDDGKPFTVTALPDGNVLRVRCNGQEHATRLDVWVTSCWQLPAAPYRNGAVPLMGCDTGKDFTGRLQFIATEPLNLAGQAMTCAHYRMTSTEPHEFWYDGQERMVRQEWLAQGHRTVMELARMHR